MIFKEEKFQKGLTEDELKALTEIDDSVLQIAQKVVTNKINSVNGEIYMNVEQVVQEVTGIEKEQGQRATDYMKSAFSKKFESANQDTIEDLKSKLDLAKKSGGDNKDLLDKLEALQEKEKTFEKTMSDKTKEWEKKLEDKTKEAEGVKFMSHIERSMPKLKHEDKGYVDFLTNDAVSKISSDYEPVYENGSLILKKDFQTFNPKEVLSTLLKDHLHTDRSGSGNGASGGSGGAGDNIDIDISGATTQVQATGIITSNLLKSGIERGSDEFNKKLTEAQEAEGFAALPMR